VTYNELVKVFNGTYSKSQITKHLDYAFDLGFLEGNWDKIGDKWMRFFTISEESENLVKAMYDSTEEVEE